MPSFLGMSAFMWQFTFSPPTPDPQIESLVKLQAPTWGKDAKKDELKATWLGHACFLVELPTPVGAARGPRVLFDPVFSHRCSPSAYIGPGRYTKPPCPIESIPDVDAVVISHNHYDHLDEPTITTLRKQHDPHFFVPLNNDAIMASLGIAPTHTHILDWWENREVSVELPTESGGKVTANLRLTCTPAQHMSARGMFDRMHTLWASWALEELPAPSAGGHNKAYKVWFGGDTGYRHVDPHQNEEEVPVCPAFKEIGDKFGGFDLALIPIGAYNPRGVMSSVHASPSDAVRIFQDIKAKKAIGMHWGTWVLTIEPVMEPPNLLVEEVKKAGLHEDAFTVCGLGETVVIP
ncbi:hypothetical protein M408DRAFT_331734 [Serendipita vermifera MAFF 305830]|uniref:Metallo-beta-lactamase domain-containing protein n=1 Tax=Serendipita vermifera MAFF 305830 TaxID=933852 RepID=A0A0C3AIL7_SERVB|nr:hypothetical protein M408DRAFT_331734 [Serendipita vermifera MAFF 305830]